VPATITREGRNCWRRPPASRVAFLVDGASYFGAFAAAAERAEHSILMLCWDVHSRIRLRRDGRPRATPDKLGDFLRALLHRRPTLEVRILDWDFVMVYALERETLLPFRSPWRGHPRLHFRLDTAHPLGASHHQKVVVIDDAVAFVGGLDLAACRWDVGEHPARDPRRTDPGFGHYGPFHDIQMAVDGAAAAALADLARDRWQRATGERLAPVAAGTDPWPPDLAVDLADVPVAISRTDPAWDGRPDVREVEALFVDAIAAARRSIYVECQYFTAERIGDALAARLGEPDGPEVIAVAPAACPGWLEELTMGVLRGRILARLRAADRFGRLHLYQPFFPDAPDCDLTIHSKVMVIDDTFLRIGSANVSNRSMGLDTECDLSIDANDDSRVREAIAGFRNRLVAEQLGVPPARFAEALAARESLAAAIDHCAGGGGRTLRPLTIDIPPWLDELVPAARVIDPDRPIARGGIVKELLLGDLAPATRAFMLRYAALLAGALVLGTLWQWTPLGRWIGVTVGTARPLTGSPLAVPLVVAAFVAGQLLLVPVTVMMAATVVLFGPVLGFGYALLGSFTAALVGYGIGRLLPRGAARGGIARMLSRMSPRLAGRGMRALATAPLVPIAPFLIVNLAAGAARVRPTRFMLRATLTLVPASVVIALVTDAFVDAVRKPQIATVAVLLGALALALLVAPALQRRRWRRRRP
jgi:phosphatidylserine/phosphatidylglycerophosphate/cardiolipin synthase-like enzyme/uncharacterized membrane protein YdjX (TVP38/TMEM64 family)